MRDLHSQIKVVTHVAAQAITTTNTPASGVDRAGFNMMEFIISVGTITNIANSPQPSWAFKLQESDSASASFTDVTDSDTVLVGSAASPATTPNSSTGVFLTIDEASEDATHYRIGYIGLKRYVRVIATAANTPGSTPYSVVCVLGEPSQRPTAD